MGTRWSALVAVLGLWISAPSAAQDDRITELERKVEVLTEEIASLKLGAVADTVRYATRAGLAPAAAKVYSGHGVSIGGYGELLYENFDRTREDHAPSGATDRIDHLRQVIYLGFKFSDDLLFNSEIELEHAGVRDEAEVQVDPASGEGQAELTGEVSLEFAYVDWSRGPAFGVRAGTLLVPLGLVNEMHEPPVFLGARRPDVERLVIPSTWSANGAGVYGEFGNGIAYRAYVLEGLDARHFSAGEAIRGGRQSGSKSIANRPALAARIDWAGVTGLAAGGSLFAGDSWQVGQPPGGQLEARVTLFDAHARYQWRGLEACALYAHGSLGDAGALSDALGRSGAERLGKHFFGGYGEVAYDLVQSLAPGSGYRLVPYARIERYDTQEDVPGGSEDPELERTVVTVGAALAPHPNVVLKIDHQARGNRADTATSQWNAALGYSF